VGEEVEQDGPAQMGWFPLVEIDVLADHHAVVLAAVGRHFGVGVAEGGDDLLDVDLVGTGDEAVVVEGTADQHQPAHEIGPPDRHVQRHRGAHAVTQHMGGPANGRLDEGDDVTGEGVDVGREGPRPVG
jgi:hypothetical protein